MEKNVKLGGHLLQRGRLTKLNMAFWKENSPCKEWKYSIDLAYVYN